ncbi:MAG: hypothetical protein ACK5JD_06230 [Mangrovibacterium sp.]
MENKGTYKRKYYLHRRIKAAGFKLQLEEKHKTIWITPDQAMKAKNSDYVAELQSVYQYGVQILNPMML